MIGLALLGIGTAVPPHAIRQGDAAEIAQALTCSREDESRYYRDVYHAVGVDSRHSVILDRSDGDLAARQSFYARDSPTTGARMRRYESAASDLAVEAGAGALSDAGVSPDRITHVVTVTCSGFYSPGLDVALIKRLGLRRSVERTQVGFMGCHGAINGLRVARAVVGSDPSACVLLCCAELCSLHHQYDLDPSTIIANALFADGAAAVVCVAGDDADESAYRVVATGSTLVDDTEDVMSWRIGDHGFAMTLSAKVPKLIARHLRPWLDVWLSSHGLRVDLVPAWAVHPGGPRILTAFSEATGVGREGVEASYRVLARYGNMSSPTVLFVLDELRKDGAPRPCVAMAFGPGLAVEAALLV
ncbi:MAG TPA: type III polyketide synthase [Isosphaeraceae bacterium]|jgi:predicted naringenin-chalcone synthase|nr:type III polyketide synthase [Isosphaeraceae bacterium]